MRNRYRVAILALVVLLLTIVGWSLFQVNDAFNQRDEALKQSTSAATQNKIAAQDACDQVRRIGGMCEVDTSELKSGSQVIKSVPGLQGIPGVPGQVGKTGPPPSLITVKLALLNVCGGDCKGVKGDKGDKGDTITGPSGTSTNGADGKNGTDGKDGRDGVSVESVTCDGTTGMFTLSDGRVIPVSNMCAAPLLPSPPDNQ